MELDRDQRIALSQAISSNDLAYVKRVFTQFPVLAKSPIMNNGDGKTWLNTAAYKGRLEICRLLIDLGADVNAVHSFGTSSFSVIEHAVDHDHLDVVQLLVDHGASVDGERLVIGAIAGEHERSLELVKLLEMYGADIHREMVNELTGEPMNALSTAIDWGRQDVVDYLKSRGAKMPAVKAASPKAPTSKKKR